MSISARLDRLTDRVPIDWWAFGRTKGAFVGDIYEFMQVALVKDPEPLELKTVGGFCAPASPVRWRPWATYSPPMPTFDLFPTLRAPRGGIRFLPPISRLWRMTLE